MIFLYMFYVDCAPILHIWQYKKSQKAADFLFVFCLF